MRAFDRSLTIICLAALTVRIIFVLTVRTATDTGEMAAYNAVAVGGVFPPSVPPLYPLFLRAVYSLFGMREYAAVFAIQGVISCLVVIAVFQWAARCFDKAIATVAAALAAGYPNFILYNAATLPVSLSVTLTASIMAVSVSRMRAGPKSGIGAALAGGGLLMNPAYIFLLPGLAVISRKRLIFVAALAATVAPWIVYTAVVHDTVVPVLDPRAFGFRFDAYGRARDAWDVVSIYYHGASMFMGEGWRSYTMDGTFSRLSIASHVRSFSYAALMLVGLTGLIRYWRREHRDFVVPFIGYVILIAVCAPPDGRQRAVLEPLLILFTAVLLVNEYRVIRTARGRERRG